MNTVYKLVYHNYSEYFSINALGSYRTQYTPGERVDKQNLFVFIDQEDAIAACFYDLGEQVWECESNSTPRPTPEWVPDYDYTGTGSYRGVSEQWATTLIAEFWKQPYEGKEGPLYLIRPPKDSYLVDDVKLIRHVPRDWWQSCDE